MRVMNFEQIRIRWGLRVAILVFCVVGVGSVIQGIGLPLWMNYSNGQVAEQLVLKQMNASNRQHKELIRTIRDTKVLNQKKEIENTSIEIEPTPSVESGGIKKSKNRVPEHLNEKIAGGQEPINIVPSPRNFTVLNNEEFSLCGFEKFTAEASSTSAILRNSSRLLPSDKKIPLRGWESRLKAGELTQIFQNCWVSVSPAESQGTRYLMLSEQRNKESG